jgi:hypothetical protein
VTLSTHPWQSEGILSAFKRRAPLDDDEDEAAGSALAEEDEVAKDKLFKYRHIYRHIFKELTERIPCIYSSSRYT